VCLSYRFSSYQIEFNNKISIEKIIKIPFLKFENNLLKIRIIQEIAFFMWLKCSKKSELKASIKLYFLFFKGTNLRDLQNIPWSEGLGNGGGEVKNPVNRLGHFLKTQKIDFTFSVRIIASDLMLITLPISNEIYLKIFIKKSYNKSD